MADAAVAGLKAGASKALAKMELDQALAMLTEALTLAPDDVVLLANRAYVHELRRAPEDALADSEVCISRSPGFAKGYLRGGRALLALNRPTEARQPATRLARSPPRPRALEPPAAQRRTRSDRRGAAGAVQAMELLRVAAERFPQDYALREALNDAASAATGAAAVSGVAAREAESRAVPRAEASRGKGLASSYYYAAVPTAQQKLPVAPPARIDATAGPSSPGEIAAGGAIRHELEAKGDDSYYYAHARQKDYHVPTVPKRLEPGGQMTDYPV